MKNKKTCIMQSVIFVLLMISSAGCNSTPAPTEWPYPIYPTEDYSSRVRDLLENQAKWESQHITHYQMTVDGFESFLPVIVEVKDDNVVFAVNAQGERVSSYSEEMQYYPHYFSIAALFSYLSQTYAESPANMSVDYDPMLGYPLSIYIDPFTEPCCQDFSIEILDFHVLSP